MLYCKYDKLVAYQVHYISWGAISTRVHICNSGIATGLQFNNLVYNWQYNKVIEMQSVTYRLHDKARKRVNAQLILSTLVVTDV